VPQRGATDNIVPETIVPVLPFLFHSEDHVHAVLDGPISNETLTAMEKANMVGLAFYESGARSMYTTRPIRTLADIQHRKIRVQQSDLRGREALHADRALDGARGAGVLQMDLEPPAGRGPSAGPPSGQGLGPAHAQALGRARGQARQVVEAGGAQIIQLEDKQACADAMRPVYKKFADTPELKGLVQRIQASQGQ
jgi:TRAP-type C4-dicarboxylate transport system substrate-binding protein